MIRAASQFLADPIVSTAIHMPAPSLMTSFEAVAIVIARDEAAVLARTLPLLQERLGESCDIHVVADHCHDSTAQTARRAGVHVHERSAMPANSKAAALEWWLRRTHRSSSPDQVVIVFDADSEPEAGFVEGILEAVRSGAPVAQANVEPAMQSSSPIARLAAFSERAEQLVHDVIRQRLGWPVRLRGTGMAIRRGLLETLAPRLHTIVEDAELTMLLTERRIWPVRAEHATVRDPKPIDQDAATRQRARWIRGQAQLVRDYPGTLVRLIAEGPAAWSLLASILLKPKAFVLPIVSLASATLWLAGLRLSHWLLVPAVFLGTWLAWDLISMWIALWLVPDPSDVLKSLLFTPAFVAVWIRGVLLAPSTRATWLRSRPLEVTTRPIRGHGESP
jgi:cellulose synthase/poly-beta-1,6-N-acetylglucosamine synthase-like glycosyltransferase